MNMMVLGDVLFGDKDAWTVFMGEHAIAHSGINQAVEDRFNKVPSGYPLSESPENDKDWLLTHYRIHSDLQLICNTSGLPDLSDVDLKEQTQFEDWVQAHNYEHAKLNVVLGLL